MLNRDSALAAGDVIGPYRVQRILGSGAFGVVYEAVKQPLERRVALKVLRRELAGDDMLLARFLREAQAAASLKHPNIVEVDDVGSIDGVPFLAMEFLEGQSLADRIDRIGPLTLEAALDVMLPVCSAVAAVHERGIIHRDLKPDNIFLWQPLPGQIQPKLLDFGIAKLRTQTQEMALTATGTMFGTPKYMPPEQWSNSKNTIPQSDQWALAVIVYECCSGVTPYNTDNIPELVLKISTEPPRPLRELVPSAPAGLDQVLVRALSRDPQQRYGSVREFAAALLPFASPETRARWSTEFSSARTSHRQGTLGPEGFGDLGRPTHSPTIERSATEVPARADSVRSVRSRVGAVALVMGVVSAVIVGVALLNREPSPTRAAAAPPTAQPPTRTEIPAPPESAPPAPAVAAPAPPSPAPPAPAVAAPASPAPTPAVAAPEPEAPAVAVRAARVLNAAEAAVRTEHRRSRRSRRHNPRGGAPTAGEIPNL